MPFRADILNPIPGDNPGGPNLRYDPLYDKIKEARREEEDIEQGDWKRERKVADWPLTIKLSEEFLATKSKDLQIAVWLAEAVTRQRGLAAFLESVEMLQALLDQFWDNLYPEIEDGDVEFRAAPLDWFSNQSIRMVREFPLTKDGYHYFLYKESRDVGTEESATSDTAREVRQAKLKEGKLSAERFDDSFAQTPKTYYVTLDENFGKALVAIKGLSDYCDEKFGDEGPSFSRLKQTIEEVKQVSKVLLDRKREIEPDPIQDAPSEESSNGEAAPAEEGAAAVTQTAGVSLAAFHGGETGARKSIVDGVVEAAAQLRRMDATNPGSYLLTRGLRFGELRAAAAKGEIKQLEAPPTEVRRQLRVYALDGRHKDLLDLCEAAMALPASRGWLDLQRLTVEAMIGLGDDYNTAVQAIRSEIKALVHDVPEILGALLMDETPACNPQTLAWIEELRDDPPGIGGSEEDPMPASATALRSNPPWRKKMGDPFRVAVEALRRGEKGKALEIMRNEIEAQPSARGRFLRQLQVAELCVQANAKEIAQPFLNDIKTTMEEFRLTLWEERGTIVQALVDLYLYHEDTLDDSSERNRVFQQICRLDPVRALSLKG